MKIAGALEVSNVRNLRDGRGVGRPNPPSDRANLLDWAFRRRPPSRCPVHGIPVECGVPNSEANSLWGKDQDPGWKEWASKCGVGA